MSSVLRSSISRLDRRIRRDADVPRLVEVGRLVDDLLRARVEDEPDAREANALAEVLRDEHAVRAGREHLEVVVVTDDRVDAGELVGDVDQWSGRVRDRAAGRALVAEGDDRFTPFAAGWLTSA